MNEAKKIDKKKSIIRLLISIIIFVAIFLVLFLILKCLGINKINQEILQEKISAFGPLGPIIFIIFSFLQVTIIPVPSVISILAGNYLFGPWLSYLYSFIGIMLGSLFAFYLGRKIGRKFVDWIVGDKETVSYYLSKLKGKETIVLFFMFILPAFPDDALCAIAGITPIAFSVFFIIQLISRIIAIGGTLFFMSGEIIPYEGWGLVVIIIGFIIALIAFVFAFKNSESINNKIVDFVDKITPKTNKKNKH